MVGVEMSSDSVWLLRETRGLVKGCSSCGLCRGANKVVFGSGSPDADIFVIGEAPGEKEDQEGRPFVGPSGKLLDSVLRVAGLSRDMCYVANMVKARPPGNRNPTDEELKACVPYLEEQVTAVKPRVIVLLGGVASSFLLSKPISEARQVMWGLWGHYTFATYHPAYILRNPKMSGEVVEDLKKVASFLKKDEEGGKVIEDMKRVLLKKEEGRR